MIRLVPGIDAVRADCAVASQQAHSQVAEAYASLARAEARLAEARRTLGRAKGASPEHLSRMSLRWAPDNQASND
jgi:outer membrane protein TolC